MIVKNLTIYLFIIFSITGIEAHSEIVIFQVDTIKIKESTHEVSILILPIISFSPETSLKLGATTIGLFRHREADPSTNLSSFRTPISYTLNNQIKVRGSFDIFSNYNDHVFSGYAEWFKIPLLFYGIGNFTTSDEEELYTTQSYGARIDYLGRVKGKLYLGANMEMIDSEISEVQEDGQLIEDNLIPGNEGGRTMGVGLLARLDSRDNVYNCLRGFYFETGLSIMDRVLGSDFNFSRLNLDFRYYQGIVQGKHILALQIVTEHIWGDPSFEQMALLGGDGIMRGHYEGRYRDKSLYAAQLEYRLPLIRTHWVDVREKVPFKERWGLVGFIGFGAVAPSMAEFRLNETKKSSGIGIRYLAIPKARINVRVDIGFGSQLPGVYFNIREAF